MSRIVQFFFRLACRQPRIVQIFFPDAPGTARMAYSSLPTTQELQEWQNPACRQSGWRKNRRDLASPGSSAKRRGTILLRLARGQSGERLSASVWLADSPESASPLPSGLRTVRRAAYLASPLFRTDTRWPNARPTHRGNSGCCSTRSCPYRRARGGRRHNRRG